jgi:hypothetical protein
VSKGGVCNPKLSHYCKNEGPWWYGKYPDGPMCEYCFSIYFSKHKEELTLSGQGGISSSFAKFRTKEDNQTND